MLQAPDSELALRVQTHVLPHGDIVGLNVPADLLDPRSLVFWAEVELGDKDLASQLREPEADPVALLAERRRQSDRVLGAMLR